MKGPNAVQALIRNTLGQHNIKRSIDQMIGLCAGVVADGELADQEIAGLVAWIRNHEEAAHEWPCNILYARLAAALEDGAIDEPERRDLLRIVVEIAAGVIPIERTPALPVSSLPFCHPLPVVTISKNAFVLTGEFAIGERKAVMELITSQGGLNHKSVIAATNYLVVGTLGSPDWRHGSFGNKAVKAVELRQRGSGIRIVPEHHFAAAFAL